MTYTATAALPYGSADRAVAGLRGQLRLLAANDNTVPDSTTLRVIGPDEVVGGHGVVWYEWHGAVDGCGPNGRGE